MQKIKKIIKTSYQSCKVYDEKEKFATVPTTFVHFGSNLSLVYPKTSFLTLNMTLTINHILSDKVPLGEIVQVLCLCVNLI